MNPEKTLKNIRFGDFSFDYESACLRKGTKIVYLRPNAARLLAALLESPNRVVRHEHLRKVIWGNRVVEWQMGLHGLIRDIRRALEDDPRSPRYLQTIPRRGYRFFAQSNDRCQNSQTFKLRLTQIPHDMSGVHFNADAGLI